MRTTTEIYETHFIDFYNKKMLSENMLRAYLDEITGYYIDPDAMQGMETHDGKGFKQLICYIMQPLSHDGVLENSRVIDEDGGRIWENLVEAEKLFEYIWYCELDQPNCEQTAEKQFEEQQKNIKINRINHLRELRAKHLKLKLHCKKAE